MLDAAIILNLVSIKGVCSGIMKIMIGSCLTEPKVMNDVAADCVEVQMWLDQHQTVAKA